MDLLDAAHLFELTTPLIENYSSDVIKSILEFYREKKIENLNMPFYGSLIIRTLRSGNEKLIAYFQAGKITHIEIKAKRYCQTFTDRSFE